MSVRSPHFGHAPADVATWRRRVRAALAAGARTPFYLFSPTPVVAAADRLASLDFGLPLRAWFSCKTQPLPPLLRHWQQRGGSLEVVSELELHLALAAGFPVDRLLINGPAKHRWLPALSQPGLRVNFDSLHELRQLLPTARRDGWRTGLRVLTDAEFDPETPSYPTPFGLAPEEVSAAVRQLRRAGLPPETVHLHLRTNVARPSAYADAVAHVAAIAGAAGWRPEHLDLGGGLPPPFTLGRDGRLFDEHQSVEAHAARIRTAVRRHLPGIRELWLEHGRWLCAGSGVLVVQVLDAKVRRGLRQLLCDGGRTLHALVATWEDHAVVPLQPRSGTPVLTAIHGPTCMAFDLLARRTFPASLRPGDLLLWLDAGAYHLPWETEFSHPRAAVWWDQGADQGPSPSLVRSAGTAAEILQRWK